MKLYRIMKKSTNSLQHFDTFWNKEVLYCGYDKREAFRVYHENKPSDCFYGYGNRSIKTVAQSRNYE